jgi:hypothetical protein
MSTNGALLSDLPTVAPSAELVVAASDPFEELIEVVTTASELTIDATV